jgi:hypothetical protein
MVITSRRNLAKAQVLSLLCLPVDFITLANGLSVYSKRGALITGRDFPCEFPLKDAIALPDFY